MLDFFCYLILNVYFFYDFVQCEFWKVVVIFGLRNRFIHPNLIVQNGAVLARRLLNKELDPVTVLSMSPNELKVCLLFQTVVLDFFDS